MIKIAPSMLSADFGRLAESLGEVTEGDYLHVDIMDGNFVPNISFGQPVLSYVRKISHMVLDVHLMVERPIRYVEEFCDLGADIVTVHVESDTEENTQKCLELVHQKGKKAGVVIKPKTPAEAVLPFLTGCDMILVMTVEPGFGGQKFMADMMEKVRTIRRWVDEKNPTCEVEVDGGINPTTAKIAVENGANVLVAGSTVFKAEDKAAMIKALRG